MFENFLNGKDTFTVGTSTVNGNSTLTFSVDTRTREIYIYKEGLINNLKKAVGRITTDGFEIKYIYKDANFTIFFTRNGTSDDWYYKINGNGNMTDAYINNVNVKARLTRA